jgi:hypothetical protein
MNVFYHLSIITCIIAPLWFPSPGRKEKIAEKEKSSTANSGGYRLLPLRVKN